MDAVTHTLEDVPRRIFLDSSLLQTLQAYGGFLYENEVLSADDRIRRDRRGVPKLEALRLIMQVAQRAPFEFALSENSFIEVEQRGDPDYLQWAYDVLNHWVACLSASPEPRGDSRALAAMDSPSFNYLGAGDRALLKDAIALECDTFLTMENKLPKAAPHIQNVVGLRVMLPLEMWDALRPWADLFR